MKTAYREIKYAELGTLQAYVMAFEDLAHQLEIEYEVEPLFMNLNTCEWSRVVRVSAGTQQELSPFRELLDSSEREIYEYLNKANDRDAIKRRERGMK